MKEVAVAAERGGAANVTRWVALTSFLFVSPAGKRCADRYHLQHC